MTTCHLNKSLNIDGINQRYSKKKQKKNKTINLHVLTQLIIAIILLIMSIMFNIILAVRPVACRSVISGICRLFPSIRRNDVTLG